MLHFPAVGAVGASRFRRASSHLVHVMNRVPLVSVIVPMYNAERWVGAAIESALTQSWDAVEVVVVDDGSTDASLAVARRFEGDRVRVLSQPNAGASAARNRGLAAASGDLVQYLDADDLLHRDKIAVQVDRLRAEAAGRIAAGAWGRFRDDPAEARFEPEPVWADLPSVDWLVTSWNGGGMMHPAAWLTPRSVVERAGPWDTALSLNDDGEYFARVVLASSGVAFCPDARSYYRSGVAGSLSGRSRPEARASHLRTILLGGERLLAVEDSARVRAAFAAQLQRFVYETYPDCPVLVAEAEGLVRRLGGANVPPPQGGAAFRVASRLAGWKAAKRLQRLAARRARGARDESVADA